jgi:glycosyltransferase involved in cell wall biosynthesis
LSRETTGIADCYVLFQSTYNDALDRQPTDDVGAVHVFRAPELPDRLGYGYLTPKGIVPGCTHFPVIDFAKTHSYKHYWLIEGDVEFSGDWADLLQSGDAVEAGLLAAHVRRYSETPNWYWWTSLKMPSPANVAIPDQTGEPLKAFLCVYRISYDALQLIDRLHRSGWIGHSEVLLPTAIFNAGLGVVDMISLNSFYQGREQGPATDADKLSTVRWRPEVSLFEFTAKFSAHTIYHPVKDEWTFDGTNILVARTGGHARLSIDSPDSEGVPTHQTGNGIDAVPAGTRPTDLTTTPKSFPKQKRLGVIVPYRNRAQHLSKFLPHLISYFNREGSARVSDVKIIISEQNDDLPFNRGGLLNAGFLAIENMVDYVCFHDVDYLPMWADYSYADMPTRIIWWGMHSRPIRVADPSRRTLAPRLGLGAVVLFTNENFRAVNGYSNRFFGWGFEDKDLAEKCALHSLTIHQRDGTFIPLDHDNAGFQDDGSKSSAWMENERRFAENQRNYALHGTDLEGLSSFSADTTSVEYTSICGLDEAETAEVLHLRVNFDRTRTARHADAGAPGLLATLPKVVELPEAAIDTANMGREPQQWLPKKVSPVAPVPRRQKICLSMIVKNEASVIRRCLQSVLPLIDYWIIVDTGSIDGTQDIVREFLHDTPGELHERPWIDFAHNRSDALALARQHGDYSLIIDADDVLELPPGFRLPFLKEDTITIEIRNKERRYWRPQLVRNALPWRYVGVLHEFLSCGKDEKNHHILAEDLSQRRLPGAKIVMSEEGARRRLSAADRFRRDAAVLEGALTTETDPFLISRYTFYLAQSHLDAGDKQKALAAYQQRAKLGGWNQEVFISLYRSANLKADLGFDDEDVIATYLGAHAVCKTRAEALHGASRFCRIKERFAQGYDFAKRALQIRCPEDALFSEAWVYDYGVLDEYAVNAYWIGKYEECLKACRKILGLRNISEDIRKRVQANAEFALQKL